MAGVRDSIIARIVSASVLNAVGTPATAGVFRFRTLPWDATTVPAYAVYPSQEITQRVGNPVGELTQRFLTVTIECRAKGGTPDNALDSLLNWAIQQLYADETLNGYAHNLVELGTRWDAAQADQVYEVAYLDIQVNYATLTADPELRGLSDGT